MTENTLLQARAAEGRNVDGTPKRKPVISLQVETVYGQQQLVARVNYVGEDGKLRNYLGDRFEDGGEYADFVVQTYVKAGQRPTWACHLYFSPYAVELHRAEAMTKLLRKVEKGLEKITSARGYVRDGDFTETVIRVAEVLKITDFYVRNGKRAQEVSGEMFRRTDGSGVQSWVSHTLTSEVGVKID